MNFRCVKYTVAAPLLFVLSCGLHHPSAQDPLPADQVVQALQNSFKSANASAAEAVGKIVDETQRLDLSAAFTDLKELAEKPDITEDQRITAIRASKTIGQELQEAAQNGDQKAVDTIQNYNGQH
jgi:hypothetical protein